MSSHTPLGSWWLQRRSFPKGVGNLTVYAVTIFCRSVAERVIPERGRKLTQLPRSCGHARQLQRIIPERGRKLAFFAQRIELCLTVAQRVIPERGRKLFRRRLFPTKHACLLQRGSFPKGVGNLDVKGRRRLGNAKLQRGSFQQGVGNSMKPIVTEGLPHMLQRGSFPKGVGNCVPPTKLPAMSRSCREGQPERGRKPCRFDLRSTCCQ